MDRAYSLLEVKSIDDERRTFSGIATTPSVDSDGDIIEPLGISYRNPLPLKFEHKTAIGQVVFDKPTAAGVNFTATIPKVSEPGTLRDRTDEAWQMVKYGIVRGASVGFEKATAVFKPLSSGGLHFLKVVAREMSICVIPANRDATILAVKSIDSEHLAASGLHSPGVTGTHPVVRAVKGAAPMTTQEQITSFENTRTTKFGRMTAIMAKAADAGVTLDQAETEEYDTLKREVASVDEHLVRLKDHEKSMQATATPITMSQATTATTPTLAASELRGGNPVITVKANVPKGTAFTRYVMAKIIGKNSMSDSIRYVEGNKQWMDQTPEVLMMLKAAVNPGTIAEPAWAAPLAVQQPFNDFLEILRPETLIGKIPGLKNVPFNISIPVQTGGGTYNWVGEGAPKPVGNLQFSSVTLGIAKAAGIIVISEELAKISTPSAEGVVRNDMIKGMAQYLDQQFIDPTVAAVTNVSPASITNLANGFATAGTSGDNARTDLKKAITLLTAANYPISETVLVMSEANAFALSVAMTTNGVLVNPGLNAKGGTILGLTTVTSQAAGSVVALVHAPSILFADDGGVNIDVSREATVEMNTTPTSPVTASSAYVSLWQLNLIGLRAERFINWKRARTTAVVYTTATYV